MIKGRQPDLWEGSPSKVGRWLGQLWLEYRGDGLLLNQLMRIHSGGSAAPVSIIWEEAEAQGNSFPGIGMLKDQEVLLWVVRSGVR